MPWPSARRLGRSRTRRFARRVPLRVRYKVDLPLRILQKQAVYFVHTVHARRDDHNGLQDVREAAKADATADTDSHFQADSVANNAPEPLANTGMRALHGFRARLA